MVLDEILAHNRTFAAPAGGGAPSAQPRRRVCVVACMDNRLVDLLMPAMGLGRGDADLVCTAGPAVTPLDNAVIRSVSASVILHGTTEVLVVGHTGCGMAGDVLPLIEAMEAAGVSRQDVGSHDLREFYGLTPPPESNVRQVADALRRSPVIPAAVLIHGLLIDTGSGRLRVVVKGEPGSPRHELGPMRLPEVDMEAARVPEIGVLAESTAPTPVLRAPKAPEILVHDPEPPPRPPARPGIVLKPRKPKQERPAREPAPVEPIDIDLGPKRRRPAAGTPVRVPPPRPKPGVVIDVAPVVPPVRPRAKHAGRTVSRKPADGRRIDIKLGAKRRR